MPVLASSRGAGWWRMGTQREASAPGISQPSEKMMSGLAWSSNLWGGPGIQVVEEDGLGDRGGVGGRCARLTECRENMSPMDLASRRAEERRRKVSSRSDMGKNVSQLRRR